ncbi:hypothetical protein ACFYPA_23320 [Streptomyces sp. NPDC005775]|uniref:hypothetical protein n=1 Tax=unclassified Streptomyces TaxID=2593676 RepID=UPI0033D68CEB
MKRILSILSITAAALATAGVMAPTASAGVGNCKTWTSNSAPYTGSAYCSEIAAADKFRVRVTCVDPRGSTWIAYGPWVKNTKTSTVKCSDNPNVGILKTGVSFSA